MIAPTAHLLRGPALLSATLAKIGSIPEGRLIARTSWYQASWALQGHNYMTGPAERTSFCLAGWAVLIGDPTVVIDWEPYPDFYTFNAGRIASCCSPTPAPGAEPEVITIRSYAARLLGLDTVDADALFKGSHRLQDLRTIAARLTPSEES